MREAISSDIGWPSSSVRGAVPARFQAADGARALSARVYCVDANLLQQRVILGKLAGMPHCQPVPDGLLRHLLFRKRRDDFIVHQ